MNEKKFFGLNKNVFFLGLVSFFTDFSSEMILAILPNFMKNQLGIKTSIIGLIEGIADSTASFFKLFSGWLADKIKRKKVLVLIGYSLSTFAKPLIAFATNWIYILSIRFVDRVGKGIRTSPRDAMIADVTDKNERGKAYGFHRSMDTLGAVVGTAFAAILLIFFAAFSKIELSNQYRIIFLISLIPGLISVVILAFLVKERVSVGKISGENIFKNFRLLNKSFWFFMAAVCIFSVGNFSYALYMLRIEEMGIAAKVVPLAYFLYNITYVLISVPIGILSDKFGDRKMIIIGYFLAALIAIAIGFAKGAFFAWIIFILYSIPVAIINTIPRVIVSKIVSGDARGTAFGFYYALTGICELPASFIGGLIWEKAGANFAFLFSAIMSIIAVLILFFALKEKK